jgi:hypothetical protein
MRAYMKSRDTRGEGAGDDWRPLCSYTTNLERLGDGLLNTDAAWVQIGTAMEGARQLVPAPVFGMSGFGKSKPEPINERRYADQFVLQYPWIWSAGVLAGLLGLSVWILTRRVKSLDRLR